MVEIGTSGGYSALWLSLACRETGRRLVTFEPSPSKAALAAETFALTGVSDVVELVNADARGHVAAIGAIAFCFLDAEKETYADFYNAVVPRLVRAGLLAADNAMTHRESLRGFLERALADEWVDSVLVPIGQGVMLSRKL